MNVLKSLVDSGELERLPSIGGANLPANYEAACTAMAQCGILDECQHWADDRKALASYARQACDEHLHNFADRIQARAVRRCSELLRKIAKVTDVHPGEGTVQVDWNTGDVTNIPRGSGSEMEPLDVVVARNGLSILHELVYFCEHYHPIPLAAGVQPYYRQRARDDVRIVSLWLNNFIANLEE